MVVVCGNSNEKDNKQAKRKQRNYFLSRKVELTLYFCTAPPRPCPHVSVLVFFFPVWPTVHTYPGKTVTENASFENALQRGDFRKSRFLVYVWTDENGGFPIRCCHTLYSSSMMHAPKGMLSSFLRCSVFMWMAENDSNMLSVEG